MIHAYLHSKVPELENAEDLLTSTVFGRLKYLPPEDALIPFIESAFIYDQQRTTIKQYCSEKDIILSLYKMVTIFFWPRHAVYGEPDLILLFSEHENNKQDLLLLIEAKFKSSKSGTGDHDQLKRYYIALTEQISEFYQDRIADFSGIIGPLIYLTESEACSEIAETEHEIKRVGKKLEHPVFHLRWQQLYKILDTLLPVNEHFKAAVINDLICYLRSLNLMEFSGFSVPDKSYKNFISPIFFKQEETIQNETSYFLDLPKINLNKSKFIFYRE